jgi:hypothetical protein
MVREQLDASGGWVRCGHCMDVFDAKSQLAVTDPLPETAVAAPLSFVQQAANQAFWQRPMVRIGLILMCLFAALLLAAQVLRSERDRIALVSPAVSGLSTKLCQLWPCAPIARLQIDGWVLDNSSFQKASGGQFRLGMLLKNNSQSDLLVPHVDVSLLDANETVLLRKSIDLSTNLAGQVVTAASGEERKFDLLLAPSIGSATITGYRLVLFYP